MKAEPISVTIITYNEEAKIADALRSVQWADEIIVVDSYSTDRTLDICKEYRATVYSQAFTGFGALKNAAIDRASHDWILSLDADERVTEELREDINRLQTRGFDADGYAIPRKNYFLGRWIRYCGWYPDYRSMQLFNRQRGRFTDDLVHERLVLRPGGRKADLKNHIIQYPFLDVSQFLNKNIRYARLRAEEMVRQGRRFHVYQLITHPVFMFFKMFIVKRGLGDGLMGFMLSMAYAYFVFTKYAWLWELDGLRRQGRSVGGEG